MFNHNNMRHRLVVHTCGFSHRVFFSVALLFSYKKTTSTAGASLPPSSSLLLSLSVCFDSSVMEPVAAPDDMVVALGWPVVFKVGPI